MIIVISSILINIIIHFGNIILLNTIPINMFFINIFLFGFRVTFITFIIIILNSVTRISDSWKIYLRKLSFLTIFYIIICSRTINLTNVRFILAIFTRTYFWEIMSWHCLRIIIIIVIFFIIIIISIMWTLIFNCLFFVFIFFFFFLSFFF